MPGGRPNMEIFRGRGTDIAVLVAVIFILLVFSYVMGWLPRIF
jgi:hypothetical protein